MERIALFVRHVRHTVRHTVRLETSAITSLCAMCAINATRPRARKQKTITALFSRVCVACARIGIAHMAHIPHNPHAVTLSAVRYTFTHGAHTAHPRSRPRVISLLSIFKKLRSSEVVV